MYSEEHLNQFVDQVALLAILWVEGLCLGVELNCVQKPLLHKYEVCNFSAKSRFRQSFLNWRWIKMTLVGGLLMGFCMKGCQTKSVNHSRSWSRVLVCILPRGQLFTYPGRASNLLLFQARPQGLHLPVDLHAGLVHSGLLLRRRFCSVWVWTWRSQLIEVIVKINIFLVGATKKVLTKKS